MSEPTSLWVRPSDLDPDFSLDILDPTDELLMRDYASALDACKAASQTLWALSGRKYHVGTVEHEQYGPGAPRLFPGVYTPGSHLPVYDGVLNFFFVHPEDWNTKRIRLSGQPVREVFEVRVIGSNRVLTPDEYHISNRTFLILHPDTPTGVEISYTHGQEPPAMGKLAAKALAMQFYYLWSGREDQCTLPDRVTSVNRQGVQWVLLDQQDFLDELKTGVYAVDLFLRQVNPDKARVKAKIFSVDIPRGNRRMI